MFYSYLRTKLFGNVKLSVYLKYSSSFFFFFFLVNP